MFMYSTWLSIIKELLLIVTLFLYLSFSILYEVAVVYKNRKKKTLTKNFHKPKIKCKYYLQVDGLGKGRLTEQKQNKTNSVFYLESMQHRFKVKSEM